MPSVVTWQHLFFIGSDFKGLAKQATERKIHKTRDLKNVYNENLFQVSRSQTLEVNKNDIKKKLCWEKTEGCRKKLKCKTPSAIRTF